MERYLDDDHLLVSWDPWWPVTARPRALTVLRESEPALPTVMGDAELTGPSIESALSKLENALSAATVLSSNERGRMIATALAELAAELRRPRGILEDLLGEVGTTVALGSIAKMEGRFGALAECAEDLLVVATTDDPSSVRLGVRRLLRAVEATLADEVQAVMDVYWCDAGVVD